MHKTNKVEHFLGIDYGSSKVGLALADSEIRIAFAYSTLDNDRSLWDVLAKIIEIEEIDQIIIGKLNHAGANKQSFDAEEIGAKLKKEFKIPIAYQEEMFSTKMAENNLKERGAKKIKKLDNQEAARIILQSWLEKKSRV